MALHNTLHHPKPDTVSPTLKRQLKSQIRLATVIGGAVETWRAVASLAGPGDVIKLVDLSLSDHGEQGASQFSSAQAQAEIPAK